MKKFLIYFLLLPIYSQAKESPEWFKKASSFCASLSFNSSQMKCQKQVSSAKFMSIGAIDLCTSLPMPDLKLKCIQSISNKVYRDEEVVACKNNMMSSDKMKCLNELGQQWVEKKKKKEKHDKHRLSKDHRERLEDILSMLKDGRYKRARKNLQKLLGEDSGS
ncbi:hypothetical protein GW915_01650 [bacterium]|nr:hypothetical protein [bacterium]